MQNSIKLILSYIYEFPIEKIQSQFSGELTVSYSAGKYKLSTKNAIYSYGNNYTSFSIPFQALNIFNKKIDSVLVLGLGLGSVIDLLKCHPTIKNITAVDADEVIVSLAKKYLKSPFENSTHYIVQDAEEYIQNSKEKYDLVLFDVFIDNETPMQFMQKDIISELKKLVSENGILLFSKIEDSNKAKIENLQFEKIFSFVFPNSFSIDTNGNKIFTWINK